MPKISAVIITFNEERNIERCLLSIKDIVDDVVVVDSFSTDKTKDICKKYGVRFILHPFDGHIEQKNWAITQAQYPYIISLDADEAISEELKEAILKVKENWQHDGYYVNRLTNYCGKWIYHIWYPDRKLRLWDSRKGSWQGTNPHDKYILQEGSTTKCLSGDLFHYSFYTVADHEKQNINFANIAAKAKYKKGEKASILKMYFNPIWKFIRQYILLGGFLDGSYGLKICLISAKGNYLKYKILRNTI